MNRNKLLILAGVALAVSAAIAAVLLLRGGDELSSLTVRQRAEAADVALLQLLGPDTTFHMKQETYDRANEDAPAVPFSMPPRYTAESWVYFGPDGSVDEFRTDVHDAATGALLQRTTLDGSDLVISDVASGEERRIAGFDATADGLRDRIAEGVRGVRDATASTPASATMTEAVVDDTPAYVLHEARGDEAKRTYVDQDSYRTLLWERVEPDPEGGEVIVESRATPIFEVLGGRVLPDP
jgi:hypothetical protein